MRLAPKHLVKASHSIFDYRHGLDADKERAEPPSDESANSD